MNNERTTYLLRQYIDNQISEAELHELTELLLEEGDRDIVQRSFETIIDQSPAAVLYNEKEWDDVYRNIIAATTPVRRINVWRKVVAAAAILLLVAASSWFFFIRQKDNATGRTGTIASPGDINAPLTNHAVITLANGTKVFLDSSGNGTLATQANINLIKTADGQIIYDIAGSSQSGALIYNTLTNPRGSKVIDITLADGSRVWLNAGSSIIYPVVFTSNERKVEMSGEAYFEVTHDVSKPFYVSKGNMQVQVLGTHFNVNAYDDEADIRVTLLEGSVRVLPIAIGTAVGSWQPAILKPGQQAAITPNQELKTTNDIDPEQVMAWKNGIFSFSHTDIQTLMRTVSRWYDVDIVYEGTPPSGTISGEVQRSLSFLEMQKVLQLTDIKFRIVSGDAFGKGRKLIVSP